MINIQLTDNQAQLLENIIAFRVLTENPTFRPYDEDIKEEMHQVRQQIRKEMGW